RVCTMSATPGAAIRRHTAAPIPLAAPVTRITRCIAISVAWMKQSAIQGTRISPRCRVGSSRLQSPGHQGNTNMPALPEADAQTRAFFHDWLDTFAGYVREVDYAAARPLFHP